MIKPASIKNGELVTEKYKERVRPFRKLVEWNYRDVNGNLHAGVAPSLEVAEERAAKHGYVKP